MSTVVWSWVSSQLSSLTYIFSLTTADIWNYNFCYTYKYVWASLIAQLVKNPPTMQETWVWSLGWEDPVEKGKVTHSSILAWRIPQTVYPWGCKESDTTERLSLSEVDNSWSCVYSCPYISQMEFNVYICRLQWTEYCVPSPKLVCSNLSPQVMLLDSQVYGRGWVLRAEPPWTVLALLQEGTQIDPSPFCHLRHSKKQPVTNQEVSPRIRQHPALRLLSLPVRTHSVDSILLQECTD